MGSALSLRSSEFSVVWLPTKPAEDTTIPPPDDLKNDPVSGTQAMRGPGAIARLLAAFCIGVVATLGWQSCSDAARELVANSASQFGGLAPPVAPVTQITPDAIAPAAAFAAPPPDQQNLSTVWQSFEELAASQQQINRSIVQLASAQEQMAREITRLQETERSILSKMSVSVPLPRPAPSQMRMHASRPSRTAADAGPNARHSVTPHASVASPSPSPGLLTRLDTGHKRTQSSAADLKSSASDEPFGQSLMSALSRITGIRL